MYAKLDSGYHCTRTMCGAFTISTACLRLGAFICSSDDVMAMSAR